MTNAPEHFDLAQELADTADWDDTTEQSPEPRGETPDDTPDDTAGERDLAERYALRRVAGLSRRW